MREAAIEKLLHEARADPDVLAVMLFGSAARGESTSRSDVDICLVLTAGRREPIRLSEKKLDYSGRHPLDVQVFQQLPLYVRRRVLREGRVLWTRDEERLYEVAFRTAQEFEDFRPHYEEYLRSVERARP